MYAERCAALLSALEEFMPAGVSWIDAGVVFVPGAAFTAAGGPSNKLRLAYSAVPPAELREGVKRLAPVLAEAIAAG